MDAYILITTAILGIVLILAFFETNKLAKALLQTLGITALVIFNLHGYIVHNRILEDKLSRVYSVKNGETTDIYCNEKSKTIYAFVDYGREKKWEDTKLPCKR